MKSESKWRKIYEFNILSNLKFTILESESDIFASKWMSEDSCLGNRFESSDTAIADLYRTQVYQFDVWHDTNLLIENFDPFFVPNLSGSPQTKSGQ